MKDGYGAKKPKNRTVDKVLTMKIGQLSIFWGARQHVAVSECFLLGYFTHKVNLDFAEDTYVIV
jgi:hypothetical protein